MISRVSHQQRVQGQFHTKILQATPGISRMALRNWERDEWISKRTRCFVGKKCKVACIVMRIIFYQTYVSLLWSTVSRWRQWYKKASSTIQKSIIPTPSFLNRQPAIHENNVQSCITCSPLRDRRDHSSPFGIRKMWKQLLLRPCSRRCHQSWS